MKKPLVVCHRGASHHAPENTFAAADKAIELGADYVELDVRESADGVLYVMHDRTVDRTTNGSGQIAAMSSAEIDRLDAGSWFGSDFAGEKVPRLSDYLVNLKGRAGAYIEIKWCDPEKVVKTVRDLGMVDDIFWYSHKQCMRQAMLACASGFAHMVTLSTARSPSVAQAVFGATMVEMNVEELRPAVLAACRELKLQTMAYYIGDEDEVFRTMAAASVDLVNVDHADRFVAATSALPP
ncbi:glycerophosphodiester phosphodiesterase [Nitratireductor thuwali]|uniref:Glycerophosphoryl diester phosphodiesterase n=1 Tax=Nitratireductor thuwali TaxID=2267699 RepID=A0ABY5MES5_9HYPH|nr:Glycerophosphoryl diester phosphodiesterase [Nitratireductor thuwali]